MPEGSKLLELLLNNGVAVAGIAFLFWFVLKPLINSYISTVNEMIAAMKQDRENCMKQFTAISDKMDVHHLDIIKRIDDK